MSRQHLPLGPEEPQEQLKLPAQLVPQQLLEAMANQAPGGVFHLTLLEKWQPLELLAAAGLWGGFALAVVVRFLPLQPKLAIHHPLAEAVLQLEPELESGLEVQQELELELKPEE
mmetsp:Transcript_72169/g.172161  ORF Transcript_72169/g.172161 Transcript_72169/m.172161 type:complete len:115 (+) Transcript_72169:728-1072(+)